MKKIALDPVLKWAGGKRQLMPEIKLRLPKIEEKATYFEPFIGGGAVLLNLQPEKAVINDYNGELINVYQIIKAFPEKLINILKTYENDEEFFYKVRALDRDPEKFNSLDNIEKAARILFLNRTCFNGLYRVNSKNQFNVPFGKYKNPNIINSEKILLLSYYFNKNDIQMVEGDFEKAVDKAKKGDFVYFDPPYDPINETSAFTTYSTSNFNKSEQERLRNLAIELANKGVNVMLSNNDTEFIRELYSNEIFQLHEVQAMKSVGASSKSRGKLQELIITTY